MTLIDKLAQRARVLAAVLVGILALTSAARAVQTTETPNAAFFGYNLAAGGITGAIVPPANQSSLVMGCCTTLGVRGVGQVSMLRVPSSFLEWVGLNSTDNGTIAQGFSGTAGVKIVQIDFTGGAVIEVNNTDSFRVHAIGGSRAGNVTMIW